MRKALGRARLLLARLESLVWAKVPRPVRRRKALPLTAIAVSIVVTLTAGVISLAVAEPPAKRPPVAAAPGARFIAAAQSTRVEPSPVAPLSGLKTAHLLVVANSALPADALQRVRAHRQVIGIEQVDAAEIMLSGKRVATLGVDPSTFRAYTAKPTAVSDELWRNVASGDVAVSFVLGNDGGLGLGTRVGAGEFHEIRIGAFATMGIGAIDAVVSRQTGRALGIPQANALLISAPKADSGKLRGELAKVLPRGTRLSVLNPIFKGPQLRVPSTGYMTSRQVSTILTAAGSRVGRPYVWGAEGPDAFDCSGLVQWAFAQGGVKMPRVTHQQWVTGPQVTLAQMVPGDLIFWRHDPTNPGYVSHVAIYWGNGQMIVAPRTGDYVKVTPVTTRNFAGAVRVHPGIAAQVR